MTNYNLEDFKQWLEADPTRKEGCSTLDEFLKDTSSSQFLMIIEIFKKKKKRKKQVFNK